MNNLISFAPGMWRMGQPAATEEAWRELAGVFGGGAVTVVKLCDEAEGSDDIATEMFGWTVLRYPMPPEDDKPWTVLEKPDPKVVDAAVSAIIAAHDAGHVVAWHCVHGRDRTSLISALVGMQLFGWSKKYAWQNMLQHGFRWELPCLDAYWLEDV